MNAPSDRMLNHVVSVRKKLPDCNGYGPSIEQRAALRPLSEKQLAELGIPVDQPQMRAYLRENLELSEGDKIEYTDNAGHARYIRVKSHQDVLMLGRLFLVEGSDHSAD